MDIAQQMQAMQRQISLNNDTNTKKKENVVVQEVRDIRVEDINDYFQVYNQIVNDAENYKDLIRFAFMLEKKNYIKFSSPESLKNINEDSLKHNYYIDIGVFFCNTNSATMFASSKGLAILEQCYLRELFSGDDAAYITFNSQDSYNNIKNKCLFCSACDKEFAICPYKLCAIIKLISQNTGKDIMSIYYQLLGDEINYLFLEGKPVKIFNREDFAKDIEGINSKSARSAYLMYQMGLFNPVEVGENKAEFTYVKLCQGHQPKEKMSEIIDFWNTKQGYYGSVIPSQKDTVINVKDNCRSCKYEQCPHKIAGYATYLARKYECDVLDILKYISDNNTAGKLDIQQNFQYDKYVSRINELPVTNASKKEYIEIIKYIVNSKTNRKIPKNAFNIVLHTNDDKMADDIFNDYANAIWYFEYLTSRNSFKTKVISIANTSFDSLIEEYENATLGMVFHIRKIELLENTDDITFVSKLQKWISILEKRKGEIVTFVSGDKYKLQSFFNKTPKLYNSILSHHLFVGDMNEETVYNKIYERLNENFKLEENFEDALWNCIAYHYQNSELKSNEYVDNFYDNIIFNHYSKSFESGDIISSIDLPETQKKRSEGEIFNEINSMIGLASIKEELTKINNLMKFNQKMKHGRSASNMHMVFSGSAGTGKTTVAKLLAEILYTIGAIRQNKIIVCSGKDLIGQYVGQSAPKVAKICEQAYNGILFIDEAYQLNPYTSNNSDSYKEDAIAELIQQMENNRDRLVVIFAGYTKEMNEFIEKSNSGMKSRIGNVIEFPDYSKEELLQIFTLIANKENLIIEENALERVAQVIESEMKNNETFGNARFVRQLFERSVMKHAFRVKDIEEGNRELSVITAADIDDTVRG